MLKMLTIIIPCYNEERTIEQIIVKILKQKYIRKQIIIVDDNSSDESVKKILKYKNKINKIIFHKQNKGKGACIRSAQKYIKGSVVIIQDADLEYDPDDYKKLIEPITSGKRKVVYGSRFLKKSKIKIKKNFHNPSLRVFGNIMLTKLSNFLNKQNLTDAHTCYKVFDSILFKSIKLKENDFAFCPEITSIISKKKIKILELPIKYKGRGKKEGKKISLNDALRACIVLFKLRFR